MQPRSRKYGSGAVKSKVITFSFPLDGALHAQLQAIADDREWTINHVLGKVVPLGLEVYLRQITLPSNLELRTGNEPYAVANKEVDPE